MLWQYTLTQVYFQTYIDCGGDKYDKLRMQLQKRLYCTFSYCKYYPRNNCGISALFCSNNGYKCISVGNLRNCCSLSCSYPYNISVSKKSYGKKLYMLCIACTSDRASRNCFTIGYSACNSLCGNKCNRCGFYRSSYPVLLSPYQHNRMSCSLRFRLHLFCL